MLSAVFFRLYLYLSLRRRLYCHANLLEFVVIIFYNKTTTSTRHNRSSVMFDTVVDFLAQLSAAVGATRVFNLLSSVLFNGLHLVSSGKTTVSDVQPANQTTKSKTTNTKKKQVNVVVKKLESDSKVLSKRQLFPLGSLRVEHLASSSAPCPVACATDTNFNLFPVRNNSGGVIGWDFSQDHGSSWDEDAPAVSSFFDIPQFQKTLPDGDVMGAARLSGPTPHAHNYPAQQQQQQQQHQHQHQHQQQQLPFQSLDGFFGQMQQSAAEIPLSMDSIPTYNPRGGVNNSSKLVMRRGTSVSSRGSASGGLSVSPNSYPYNVPQGRNGSFVRSDSQGSSTMETPDLQQSSPSFNYQQMQQQQPHQHQQQVNILGAGASSGSTSQPDIYPIFDTTSIVSGDHRHNSSCGHSHGNIPNQTMGSATMNDPSWFGGVNNDYVGHSSEGSSDEFELPVNSVSSEQPDDFWKVQYNTGSYESLGSTAPSSNTYSLSPQSNLSASSYSKSPESLDVNSLPVRSSANRGRKAKTPVSSGGEGCFVCPECDAAFKIKGYLTRHIKKHATTKAYTCPFYDPNSEHPCHPNGGFSRRDTYKTHLKARHFIYPPGTRSQSRGKVSGKCQGCGISYDCNEDWVEDHIQSETCPGVVKNRQQSMAMYGGPKPANEVPAGMSVMAPMNDIFAAPNHAMAANMAAVLTI